MIAQDKINVLNQIIATGACGAPPPVFGWLVESDIILRAGYQRGFDTARARGMLMDLEAQQ